MKPCPSSLPVFLLIVVCGLSLSCKKDEDNISSKVKRYSVTTKTASRTTTQNYEVTYDGEGRIARISYGNTRNVLTYALPASYTEKIYADSALLKQTIYLIGTNQLIDSLFYLDSTGQITASARYLYNNANQLIELRRYGNWPPGVFTLGNRTTYTYDGNGNLTQEVFKFENNTIPTSPTITDYTYTNLQGEFPIHLPFSPVFSKNLMATLTISSGSTPGNPYNYSYTFDSHRRMITQTADQNGYTTTWNFFYQ